MEKFCFMKMAPELCVSKRQTRHTNVTIQYIDVPFLLNNKLLGRLIIKLFLCVVLHLAITDLNLIHSYGTVRYDTIRHVLFKNVSTCYFPIKMPHQ